MPSLRRNSLAEQATEAIIDLIEDKQLRDGDALPATAELAEMLDVSVPVIREAIAGLAAIGLLKRQQGRESTVSIPDSSHMSRLLKLRAAGTEVEDERLQEFREIVEVGNASLAAGHRSDADLEALDEAMQQLRSVRTTEELHAADVAFHAAVARATANDLCELTLEALEPLLWRLRRRVWGGWVAAGGGLDTIVEAHSTILEAIRSGDASGAARAMTDHLAQARTGLETALDAGAERDELTA
ncbi:FadR/GntR family transcriptional regulator [Homoserinibacter sp. YIM 151385]|uniref:FadR/GntR family transcriptional regulator n=1 Tax=Homoserinibacter sp. YIM 151385 TaxID=2985506 RepID=UPI0022F005D0|nr:FCD domain-containing protein [Homoserinibacter sp. YIM 151385]WBU37508.1 FCD domain-containing protein [Homoserinibacter sp. YIM 151385]